MSESTSSSDKPRRSFIILPGAMFVYANGAYVGATMHDIRLLFYNDRVEPTGQKQDAGTTISTIRQVFAEVILLPEAADALCKSLEKRIKEHKEKFRKQPA